MCGIVGVLDPRRRRDPADVARVVEAMMLPMAPRGPDGSGRWIDDTGHLALGHRRLAVLDLSEAGHQPMTSSDGRFVITYNGEIYNHDEVSADLRREGVRFRGHSDTEYLVEAIARWGIATTLERIDGMFAFAVWDCAEQRLVLARDRLGEKPLYYGTLGGGEVVFGSSLDALRAHPGFDRPIDPAALTLFFRHKYVPAPRSIHLGVRKLEPGTWVEIGADGQIGSPVPYWDLLSIAGGGRTFGGTFDDAVDRLDELLRTSIRRRLVADVPVGAFLSGGIDSSTIAAIAQEVADHPVKTFTIGSPASGFDESAAAAAVARHLGTDHTTLTVTGADALAVVDRLGAMYDEPFADSSQIPTHLVSKLARRQVTVSLSGDAGDELFGGYNRYVWVPAIWKRLDGIPLPLRRAGARLGKRVPTGWWDMAASAIPERRRPRQAGGKVAKVLDVADASSGAEVFHRVVSHWQHPQTLVRSGVDAPSLHGEPDRWPGTSLVEQMMAVDTVTYLPDDILAKVDRASMAVSLEVRVPFLDRSIVELAASLPVSMLIRGGRTKAPVRAVLDRYVPSQLVERPKAGFGVPLEAWLRGPLAGWARERLQADIVRTHLDGALIDRAWTELQRGRGAHAYRLWDVLMFAEWADHRGIDG